jgi:hypothetical protein
VCVGLAKCDDVCDMILLGACRGMTHFLRLSAAHIAEEILARSDLHSLVGFAQTAE